MCLAFAGSSGAFHPDYLDHYLTPQQYLDWSVYIEKHGPLGAQRLDHLTLLTAAAYHASLDQKSRPEFDALIPAYLKQNQREQSPDEILAFIRSQNRIANKSKRIKPLRRRKKHGR